MLQLHPSLQQAIDLAVLCSIFRYQLQCLETVLFPLMPLV